MASDRNKFIALDGVRGVGALCVLFAHTIYAEDIPYVFAHANAGVDLFFLLSGFVIAHACEGALRTTMTLKDYVRVRLLRLYPTIFLGALISFVVAAAFAGGADGELWLLFVLQALVIPALGSAWHTFPLNVAYWSLFFEFFANLVHATLVKQVTEARLLLVAAAGAAGLIACALHFGTLSIGWAPQTFIGGFARVTYAFALGLLFYRWHSAGKLRAPRVHVIVPLALLVIAMGAPAPDWPYAIAIHDLLTSLLLFPAIMVLAITARTPNWLAPILTWLGLISYPLYALHMPMIHIFSGALLPDVVPHQIKALGWSGVMVLTMLLSWAVAALYEPKARGWLEGVWRRKPRAPWAGAAKA